METISCALAWIGLLFACFPVVLSGGNATVSCILWIEDYCFRTMNFFRYLELSSHYLTNLCLTVLRPAEALFKLIHDHHHSSGDCWDVILDCLFIFRAIICSLWTVHACCLAWSSRLYVFTECLALVMISTLKSVFSVNPAYFLWPWALVSVTWSLSSPR